MDRLSLRHVVSDHWQSLRLHGRATADVMARGAFFLLPVGLGAISAGMHWWLTVPGAILPAVALLAGVLLATSGQLITLRARIADSVLLSGNARVRQIFREALSGVVLAAVVALGAALVLGVLAVVAPVAPETTASASDLRTVSGELLTALAVTLLAFLTLMFVATARRLYAAYLSAFEGSLTLRARAVAESLTQVDRRDQDESDLSEFGIPEKVRSHHSDGES